MEGLKRRTPSRSRTSRSVAAPRCAAIAIGTSRNPIAVASCTPMLPKVVRSPSSLWPMIAAGIPITTPVPRARKTPSSATHGPQFEYGNRRGRRPTPSTARLASMSPAVSQVSRSTKTRLRFLRRLVFAVVLFVLAMIALSQFTELKRLAGGILASTAVLGLIVGFAAQHTIGNLVAGVQIAVSQPFRIGDRISFEENEGRVTDITLSYTYIDPGDGSHFVIPNQLLVEGIVHNHSTEDTQA